MTKRAVTFHASPPRHHQTATWLVHDADIMAIYIVKNSRHEEMGAFTNLERAIDFAEQIRDEFDQQCVIEEIDFASNSDTSAPNTPV